MKEINQVSPVMEVIPDFAHYYSMNLSRIRGSHQVFQCIFGKAGTGDLNQAEEPFHNTVQRPVVSFEPIEYKHKHIYQVGRESSYQLSQFFKRAKDAKLLQRC